jgi:inner membrane transporter RhtA
MNTPAQARPTGHLGGVAMMVTSGSSSQLGAAVGALAFPVIGPVGVVAVRQWVAAVLLVAAVRPRFWTWTRRQLWPVIALAVVFGLMNLGLYTAIDRVGLGLAVTLEFLGPLAVALCSSRRRLDLACGIAAGLGVVVLTRPEPTTDYVGIACGLGAAACWAAYILLNRVVGTRLPKAEGSAASAGLSGLAYVPVGVWVLQHHTPTPTALLSAAAAGVLSSAVPMIADLWSLRRVPAQFFGLFMSINPVIAAVVGLVVLGQSLPWPSWVGIGVIVAANAVAASRPVERVVARPGLDDAAPGEADLGRAARRDVHLQPKDAVA